MSCSAATRSVLLLSRYQRLGPSSRVRHYNFLEALARAGFAVESAPLLDDECLRRIFDGRPRGAGLLLAAYARRLRTILAARKHDLVWVEKEALPWVPAWLERMLLGRRPMVVDFDDPWHLRYATHRIAMVRWLLGHKLETVVARAGLVTVGSPALLEWARGARAVRVIELPSTVDLARYPLRPLPDGPLTLGWIGTPANETYLSEIAAPLRRLHASHGARLRLIGGSGRFTLPGVPIEHVPWCEETEADAVASCHVGLMPLIDGAWERGKCGYKLIQYMAAARPAVASPVGAVTAIMTSGETGFVAGSDEQWYQALAALADDRARMRAMGLAGRQRVEERYTVTVVAPRLVAALGSALAPPSGKRSSR